MTTRINIKGRTFGRWLVISFFGRAAGGSGHSVWRCKCECGAEKIIDGMSLLRGASKSCGCLRRDVTREKNANHNPAIVKHGMPGTPEWSAYKDARHRCTHKNNPRWKDYGGRGIKFLFHSFEDFIAEIGRRPGGTSLDRINNDGNYERGNIRWATAHEQRVNQGRLSV